MTCKICKWANHPPCPKNIPCCDCKEECNSRQCAEVTTKVCRNCKRELPLTDFYPQHSSKDGRRAICKHCYIGSLRGREDAIRAVRLSMEQQLGRTAV